MAALPTLIRDARRKSGLTQAELAERLETTQSAIARLERADANPTLETLDRALRAAGHRLELKAVPVGDEVDESQIRKRLRLTPAERLSLFERSYANMRDFQRQLRPAGA